jgi:hypothetical protein
MGRESASTGPISRLSEELSRASLRARHSSTGRYPSKVTHNNGSSHMVKNVGTQDRNIRYAAGALLILAGLLLGMNWLLIILGAIAIGTAYFGTCLAYLPFKIDTTKSGE